MNFARARHSRLALSLAALAAIAGSALISAPAGARDCANETSSTGNSAHQRPVALIASSRRSSKKISADTAGDASEAASASTTASLNASASESDDPDLAWRKVSARGATAFEQSKYGEAERLFKQAVSDAQKFGANDTRLATSLTNLGVLYASRGQTAKAEPLFERALSIQVKALGPYHQDVISSEVKLCTFYLKTGNTRKADPLAAKIAAYADKTARDKQSVEESFKRLTVFYGSHPELENAEIMVRQAEEMTEKRIKEQDVEVAILLDRVADSLTGRKQLAQAEPLLKRALELRERALPETHLAIAASLENLAKLYVAENQFAKAEPLFQRSLEISKKTIGEDRGETFSKIDGLAQCYAKAGQLQQAEALYRQSLHRFQEQGKHNAYLFTCQTQLGAILAREGKYQEAVPLMAQALKSAEKINGPQHASLSPLLDAYADALDKSNKHSEAIRMRARAKAIRG